MKPVILQNAVRVKCSGEFVISGHRHDFRPYDDGSEHGGFIDGGNCYIRTGGDPQLVEDYSLTSESSMEERANKFLWGTRGKNLDKPLKFVLLKDCETDHLKAILANVPHISPERRETIEYILKSREGK